MATVNKSIFYMFNEILKVKARSLNRVPLTVKGSKEEKVHEQLEFSSIIIGTETRVVAEGSRSLRNCALLNAIITQEQCC